MKVFDLYRAYFIHQCENHPSLVHEDVIGSRVFEMVSVEEALGDFRTAGKEKGFVFRLIEYTYQVGDNDAHQIRKQIQGGFIVAKYHGVRSEGKAAYFLAMEDSEKVVDEIIAKMITDSQDGHPLFFHSLDSRQEISVSPTLRRPDGSYSGWICLFSFSPHFPECVEDTWLDGGLTPKELIEN